MMNPPAGACPPRPAISWPHVSTATTWPAKSSPHTNAPSHGSNSIKAPEPLRRSCRRCFRPPPLVGVSAFNTKPVHPHAYQDSCRPFNEIAQFHARASKRPLPRFRFADDRGRGHSGGGERDEVLLAGH